MSHYATVFHIDHTEIIAKGLNNIQNFQTLAPEATIIAVCHSLGVDFLRNDLPADADLLLQQTRAIQLSKLNIPFLVCEQTLRQRGLVKEQFIDLVTFTPSAVLKIVELQHSGYAYFKP